mmetsp:Transcript_26589/g.39328  ORF Transcript_26589/g.39328 Transcript_26589/m.39328 type:complete len:211 (+) Transcript_26589:1721-2353(+)
MIGTLFFLASKFSRFSTSLPPNFSSSESLFSSRVGSGTGWGSFIDSTSASATESASSSTNGCFGFELLSSPKLTSSSSESTEFVSFPFFSSISPAVSLESLCLSIFGMIPPSASTQEKVPFEKAKYILDPVHIILVQTSSRSAAIFRNSPVILDSSILIFHEQIRPSRPAVTRVSHISLKLRLTIGSMCPLLLSKLEINCCLSMAPTFLS